MAGSGPISLVVAEAPDAWTGRLPVSLVIGAMAMGLLITAVAVQILVNGLKGCISP